MTEAKCAIGSMSQNFSEQLQNILPVEYWYIAHKVDDSSKTHFADWVKTANSEDFVGFIPLFETLKHLCS